MRAGARLDAAGKKRVAEINQRLATLFTRFSQNVLADEENDFVILASEADLAGLPDSVRAAAAAAAKARGQKGKWAHRQHALGDGAVPHLLRTGATCARRSGDTSSSRGDNGDAHDNNEIITEILKLRAERAKLLGYPTHAHWRLENAMAKTPERAMELMEAVWKPAVARVREEVADMQAHRRPRKGRRSRSSPGTTATTPRRSARRSTTSTRTR